MDRIDRATGHLHRGFDDVLNDFCEQFSREIEVKNTSISGHYGLVIVSRQLKEVDLPFAINQHNCQLTKVS